MLESLITSKVRIKLLLKFFLNPSKKSYLRQLSKEFDVSSNSIRTELNRLKKSDLLVSDNTGKMIFYKANSENILFNDIRNIVLKITGIDNLIENIVSKLGQLKFAYLSGDYANGIDSGIIEIILVGEIDQILLIQLVDKTEKLINRKIKWLILDEKEICDLSKSLDIRNALKIWG